MKFHCVLSVGGSLASYQVEKESDDSYKAVLRNGHVQRNDIPAEVLLFRQEGQWKADPWHPEVAKSLIHAIEGNRG